MRLIHISTLFVYIYDLYLHSVKNYIHLFQISIPEKYCWYYYYYLLTFLLDVDAGRPVKRSAIDFSHRWPFDSLTFQRLWMDPIK